MTKRLYRIFKCDDHGYEQQYKYRIQYRSSKWYWPFWNDLDYEIHEDLETATIIPRFRFYFKSFNSKIEALNYIEKDKKKQIKLIPKEHKIIYDESK